MNIILASASPYKKAVLEKLGIPFTCVSPDIDESAQNAENAKALSARLSLQKAQVVSDSLLLSHPQSYEESIVIAIDQVASHRGENLGKPGNYANAKQQLLRFSGDEVTFYTGITVICGQHTPVTQVETYKVQFRELTEHQVHSYLTAEQPYDCAGSFKCEGKGILLFKSMEGRDINSLVGLPLIALNEILLDLGYDLLDMLSDHSPNNE